MFYQKQVHPSIQSPENLISLYVVQEHSLLVVIAVVRVPKNLKKTILYIKDLFRTTYSKVLSKKSFVYILKTIPSTF